jgi:hypothetical protein
MSTIQASDVSERAAMEETMGMAAVLMRHHLEQNTVGWKRKVPVARPCFDRLSTGSKAGAGRQSHRPGPVQARD